MAKKLAVVFGIVFVIFGVLGFINNPIVGRPETNPIFLTNAIHDLVHLLIGVVLLLASSKGNKASTTALKVFGVIYLVLFLNGLIDSEKLLGFIPQNVADTYLHIVLAIILLIAGFAAKDKMMMDKSTM